MVNILAIIKQKLDLIDAEAEFPFLINQQHGCSNGNVQGVAFEATTSGHAGQVKLFEQLCGLIRALSSFPPESITTYRTHIENAERSGTWGIRIEGKFDDRAFLRAY